MGQMNRGPCFPAAPPLVRASDGPYMAKRQRAVTSAALPSLQSQIKEGIWNLVVSNGLDTSLTLSRCEHHHHAIHGLALVVEPL